MNCPHCGNYQNDPDAIFCVNCGQKIAPTVNNQKAPVKKPNKLVPVFSVVIAVLLVVIGAMAGIMIFSGKDEEPTEKLGQTVAEETTAEATEEQTEEAEKETEKETEKPVTAGTTIDANTLYRPSSGKFCDQYVMYASGYSEGQGYAKMRFGPSKSKYGIVGQIDNGGKVRVETVSVDGWTLVYSEDNQKEGWVRSDFLYSDYDSCFGRKKTSVAPDWVSQTNCVYLVSIEPKYAHEPLNMRSGPHKEYELVTKVANGEFVTVVGGSDSTDEWLYCEYNGYRGWLLSKYLILPDGMGDKPVLYLYPEEETDVKVRVNLKNTRFSCTYPEYNGGWNVTAYPDGRLINKADSKEYSYLYWEIEGRLDYDFSEGFVVRGEDTAEFLQKTLAEIGLTPREYNEFIVYWLPKMQNNEYNLISFQSEAYTDNVELDISPEPDSVLRVFMAYKALDGYVEVEQQSFENFERNGFTVVEWGGVEVK